MSTTVSIGRKHPLAECESCPLAKKACAPTSGPEDAKVAFVSRSPGFHDVRAHRPFAGPSGQVLDYLLGRHGVSRDKIITTNVVLCETDDPPVEAIKACKPRLEAEIANCELVVAGGAEAVYALTNRRSVSATRGSDYHRPAVGGFSQRIVVTNNPAVVLRNSDSFPDMVKDFRYAFDPIPPPTFPEVEIIDDPSTARDVLRKWNETSFSGSLATDLEWHPETQDIYAAGFALRANKAVTFGKKALRNSDNFKLLKQFYERKDIVFIWHNGQSDTKVLRRSGVLGRIDEDTFLMSYALDEYPGRHSLDYLLQTEFGWPDYTPKCVEVFKKTGVIADEDLPQLYKYNGWDTAGTFQLHEYLRPKAISDDTHEAPYRKRLLPLASAFVDVELRGFRFDDIEAANINERAVLPRLHELSEELKQITNHPLYNPRSPKQTKVILYNEWGLKHGLKDIGKKKLSDSTGKEVRTEIVEGRFRCTPNTDSRRDMVSSFAKTLNTFSKIDKQRGTYIEGLIEKAGKDGRIFGEFNPGGTVTGRPSSRGPNLQNITREGVEGIPGIRTVFLPSENNVIFQADYSQAELRSCAVLSGDENLLGIYRDTSRSLHKERASAFYGAGYTKEEYVKSKNINFGVTYGQSAFAFAQMYHMPEKEAQAYIDSWWDEFPTLLEWTNEIKLKAQREGVIRSPFGHKRRFHLITKENLGDVCREAVNFLPQNIAAWLTLHSLMELNSLGVPIIATVHDSLVADVPEVEVKETAKLVKTIMESQAKKQLGWDLPFNVDISIGPNWGTLKEIEVAA